MSGVRQRGIATLEPMGPAVTMAEANGLPGGVSIGVRSRAETHHMHHRRMKDDMGLLSFLNPFSRKSFVLSAARRLDGRSRALLAASFRPLRDAEPGWITMQEAQKLFSPVGDNDALGEMDKIGIANLAAFASALGDAQFKFAPASGRLYLIRKCTHVRANGEPERRCLVSLIPSTDADPRRSPH
jgi:hypothetical protein